MNNNFENGHYMCRCIRCGIEFIGPKYAQVCKQCEREQSEEWEALSQEEKDRIITTHEQRLISWANNFDFSDDISEDL